VLHQYSE